MRELSARPCPILQYILRQNVPPLVDLLRLRPLQPRLKFGLRIKCDRVVQFYHWHPACALLNFSPHRVTLHNDLAVPLELLVPLAVELGGLRRNVIVGVVHPGVARPGVECFVNRRKQTRRFHNLNYTGVFHFHCSQCRSSSAAAKATAQSSEWSFSSTTYMYLGVFGNHAPLRPPAGGASEGEALGLRLALGLSDAEGLALGLILADGLRLALGDKLADGEEDALALADGLRLALALADGDNEAL